MSYLADFSRVIASATEQLGEPGFAETLCEGIKGLVEADDTSLIYYRDSGAPVIEYTQPPNRMGKTTLDRYVTGPFLLDPFYRAAEVEGRSGVFRLATLAPKGFKESEYFRAWYNECGFQDECGLLIQLKHGSINLALGLTVERRKFSKRNVARLQTVFPAIESLIKHHWRDPEPAPAGQLAFRQKLQEALGAFGTSLLSPREREVIELVLLGHSTRLIAEKLGISTETVKLHRKHAYAKLDIRSQAELFYLFVDALASHTGNSSEDPLRAYHALRPEYKAR